MGGEISAGDLLTLRKLKNTSAVSNLHIYHRNIPIAAQISVVANKEATVRWKEPVAKKWSFARSFDWPGYCVIPRGFLVIFYFLKQVKKYHGLAKDVFG